jgi:Ca2+-binding EF-hand superfamily protein
MRTVAKTVSILAISVLTAGAAVAASGHHDSDAAGPGKRSDTPRMGSDATPMGVDRHERMEGMMRMMRQMHGSGAMNPGMGFMGGAGMGEMSMMDRDMMQMMMGPDMMGGMPEGMPGQMMQSRLEEYDSDGDGDLNLDEFAAWHAAMLRETMVDRFQHLDADGNGAITSEELKALAGRMNRMRDVADDRSMMRDGDMDDQPMMRNMPDQN